MRAAILCFDDLASGYRTRGWATRAAAIAQRFRALAQNRHARRSREGPLSRVKRTWSERAIPWASTSPVSSALRQPLRDPRRPTPVCQPGPGRAHHQPEAVVLDFVNPEFFAAFFFGLADSENCN